VGAKLRNDVAFYQKRDIDEGNHCDPIHSGAQENKCANKVGRISLVSATANSVLR
jgi:hypothetical protein